MRVLLVIPCLVMMSACWLAYVAALHFEYASRWINVGWFTVGAIAQVGSIFIASWMSG